GIQDAVLTHQDSRGGFFTLILTPPPKIVVNQVTPKELVFVLDTSGSMSGFPIEKAKEAMKLALDGLYPQDTFNLITFAGDTEILFPQPVAATPENLTKARAFLAGRRGGGGTEMMKAIKAALDSSDEQNHVRIVCFMTDGYVGNDFAIVSEIQKHANARVFSFGIGSSVNRFLLDKMAEAGRGEVEYVGLNDDGSAAARRFHESVRNPLLTDITVDWGGLPVSEAYPTRIPDLFGAKPVVVSGRYSHAAAGVIKLRGRMAGQPFERSLTVNLPATQPAHDAIASIWAREKIEYLMGEDWLGLQNNSMKQGTRDAITQLGLDYRLMTQFTSFVAVEERVVTDGGKPKTIQVPVELPEGVSYEGVFGEQAGARQMAASKGMVGNAVFAAAPMMRMKRNGAMESADQSYVPQVAPPSPTNGPKLEERKQTKLDSRLVSLVSWHNSQPGAAADPGGLMKNGKVEVRVSLFEINDQVLAQLKQAGLEVTFHPRGMKLLIGRIAPGRLAALVLIPAVTHVEPAR
ncbi:MAG: VWA domain-containing protein, partial [Acidobacteria bacterium]|nr:VWA domain-containing protein [Acidobacteriota bacterium]